MDFEREAMDTALEIARLKMRLGGAEERLAEAVELLRLTLLEGKENVYPYERVRTFLSDI